MRGDITPSHVANFFLNEARGEGLAISPMKLIKLAYIGYGWVKAVLDEDLFEEKIEAWGHGPIIPSLYHEFKYFRDQPITILSLQLDDHEFTAVTHPRIGRDKEDILYVLKCVWDVYKGFTDWSLRNLAYRESTPWHRTYKEGHKYLAIDPILIKEHFDGKINQYLRVPNVA